MSKFLLGFDTKSSIDKRLREYVWQRQEVNETHRIIVTVDTHEYGTFYWYWAEAL